MSVLRRLALATWLVSTGALAQVQPTGGGGDPHLQVVDYSAGQIVQLRGSPGYQMMIELSPDEQVQNVALGDSAAWQVSVNKQGDRLFLKPSENDGATNMTVVTNVRVYNFDLVALPSSMPEMPYTVQFHYPESRDDTANAGNADTLAASQQLTRYRISGDRLLRPASVSNDGQHTYITWPKAAPIPAVYAMDSAGKEVLVNGMMRTDDVYFVDGVPDKLKFRIDNHIAWATRLAQGKNR